ncbi:MAG: SpoIIE family protein phosphatase [Chthoniobacterales bacterium]|nr:SpoIIE family protein phosphatase [Chthoniobacterales bacterium]
MDDASSPGAEKIAALRHDLRTPLNQIIGYAELVSEDLEDAGHERTRDDLDRIARAAKNLAELITREIQPGRVQVVGDPAPPLVSAPATEESPENASAPDEERVVPAAIPARILIVDDHQENCAVLQRRLEREGHTCESVLDGHSALERLAGGDFDLVLLDIMMPDMDGREVLRRIKTDEKLRHLPVIMVSALDQLASVVACIERGAEDYLPKPFNPVLLRARIDASLERKRLRDAEQAAFAALRESQEKLAAELSEAAAYVQGVLPAPLAEGAVRTSWEFLPSSSLGGDAFGYGYLDGGVFGVCLLDVCGHGVGAALLSISVLNVIRSESLPGVDFRDPGAVLAGLNTAFPMERHGEMFFTAWCGIYEPSTRVLRFAAGGHPPAILVDGNGGTNLLAAKGPVIGACEGLVFSARETVVPEGARVFIFSDGAYEIRCADDSMMSYEDFRKIVARAPRDKGAAWIMEQLREQNGETAFDDDVSLVELLFP